MQTWTPQEAQTAISFLSIHVKEPDECDWLRLVTLLNFMKATKNDTQKKSADNSQNVMWYFDTVFAVHKEPKSHTGAVTKLVIGAIISSTKQKFNT